VHACSNNDNNMNMDILAEPMKKTPTKHRCPPAVQPQPKGHETIIVPGHKSSNMVWHPDLIKGDDEPERARADLQCKSAKAFAGCL